VKGADIIVTDGKATIEFDSLVNNAKVNAIEITQTVGAPELETQLHVSGWNTSQRHSELHIVHHQLDHGRQAATRVWPGGLACWSRHRNCWGWWYDECELSLTDAAGHSLWQITLSLNPGDS